MVSKKAGALPQREPGSIKSGALPQREMGSLKSRALPQREMGSIKSWALSLRELVSIKSEGAAATRNGQYKKLGRCRNEKWTVQKEGALSQREMVSN